MKNYILFILCFLQIGISSAQDDLESLLDELPEEAPIERDVKSAFKGVRVINLHSTEKVAPGAMQFLISHRFGAINGGGYQFFGLDQSSIRIATEFGLTKKIMFGFGRSSYEKTYDGFIKATLLQQKIKGDKKTPFSILYMGSTALKTVKWADTSRTNFFSSRLSYVHQLIIGSKVNDRFSFIISPTLIHKNLVALKTDPNNQFAIGIGERFKFTKRTSLNIEYTFRLPHKNLDISSFNNYYNNLSIGFDIETGGHVFQFHISNSQTMIEKSFMTETTDDWLKGGIHFGFNISRDFVLKK